MENIFNSLLGGDLKTTAILIADEELLVKFFNTVKLNEKNFYRLVAKNHNELRNEIIEKQIQQVISEQTFLNELNFLQWECPCFHTYYILDCENPLLIDDGHKNYLMNRKLWEYTVNNAKDKLAGGGWVNSYNREPFSKFEMSEFSENVYQKLTPYLNHTKKVLEIGCSSGLTMFKLAPIAGEYHAIDLSATILDKNKLIADKQGLHNIHFYHLSADEIDKIQDTDFNIVIMNSVIQCFHGYNYFRKVLKKCIDKIEAEGLIFLGDVMDLDSKEILEASLREYKKSHPTANTKLTTKGEVYYSKGFFEDCMAEFPEIETVVCSNKIATVENELTKFRYDALIFINKNSKKPIRYKKKNQFGLLI